jgi:hypothetical protein
LLFVRDPCPPHHFPQTTGPRNTHRGPLPGGLTR